MSGKRRKSKSIVGPGSGHTARKKISEPVRIPYDPPGFFVEEDFSAYKMGGCTVFVGRSEQGWHASISHPSRYPTWDEIAHARYSLVPGGVTMAMLLPPQSEFVNVHTNCFHLWQCVDMRARGEPVLILQTERP